MIITIYKKANGEILKTCNCMESDIPLQYDKSTESFIEGNYTSLDYYIENSSPVLIPESPNQFYSFDIDKKQCIDKRVSISKEAQWEIVKQKRNQLLLASDWTQLPDVPLSTKNNWAVYRLALRDITTQDDPFNITWPTSPP